MISFPFSFLITLFFFATFLQTSIVAEVANLQATCKKVGALNPPTAVDRYNFCLTSLQTVTGSQSADGRGLAVIAGWLAKANYSHNLNQCRELLPRLEKSDQARPALEACATGYLYGVNNLQRGIERLETGEDNLALLSLQEAWLRAAACNEGIKNVNGGGELLVMAKKSSDALGITDLAIKLAILLKL